MEDVAEEKAQKYGSSFISFIKEFCVENDEWQSDTLQKQPSPPVQEQLSAEEVSAMLSNKTVLTVLN